MPRLAHEECSNLSRLGLGIEQRILAPCVLVAAAESSAFAPTPAGNDLAFALSDKIRSIGEELAIHAVDRRKSTF